MTAEDKPAFAAAINRLTVALREKAPDVVQMRVYFDALQDLEIEFLLAAADRLITTAEFFPKTSEWRQLAGKIEGERTEALRAVLRNLPEPLCQGCNDTGWEMVPTTTNRWRHCACRSLRRLEVLGRRPMPLLPAAGDAHAG